MNVLRPCARLGGWPSASIWEPRGLQGEAKGCQRTGASERARVGESPRGLLRRASCAGEREELDGKRTHDGLNVPPEDVDGEHACVGEQDRPLEDDADVGDRLGRRREDWRAQRHLGARRRERDDVARHGRDHEALADDRELDLAEPAGDGDRLRGKESSRRGLAVRRETRACTGSGQGRRWTDHEADGALEQEADDERRRLLEQVAELLADEHAGGPAGGGVALEGLVGEVGAVVDERAGRAGGRGRRRRGEQRLALVGRLGEGHGARRQGVRGCASRHRA